MGYKGGDMDTKTLYILWLKGSSLRKLGKRTGVSHMTIWARLKRVYGSECCNTAKLSFVRSLYQDYHIADEDVYIMALKSLETSSDDNRYWSNHNIDMLTKYQNVYADDILESRKVYDAIYQHNLDGRMSKPWLTLTLFLFLFTTVSRLLELSLQT